jgi:hypothetical protein
LIIEAAISVRRNVGCRDHDACGWQLRLDTFGVRDLRIDHDADKQRQDDAAANQDEAQSFPLHAAKYLSPAANVSHEHRPPGGAAL